MRLAVPQRPRPAGGRRIYDFSRVRDRNTSMTQKSDER